MTSIAIVYHSKSGHTKLMAEHILQGVKASSGEVKLIDCTKEIDWDYLNSCDAIIFGCPTYMGSVSAEMKAFMDSSSNVFLRQLWRNKIAAAFTTSSALNGDKLNTLIQISLFAFQQGMIWVGLDLPAGKASTNKDDRLNRLGSWIGLMGQSSSSQGMDAPPLSDLKTANYFGQRITTFAKRLEN